MIYETFEQIRPQMNFYEFILSGRSLACVKFKLLSCVSKALVPDPDTLPLLWPLDCPLDKPDKS